MNAIQFNTSTLPVIAAVGSAAAVIAWRCVRKCWQGSHQDRQIEQINTLARIIIEHTEWWLFEGPFRIPASTQKLDSAVGCLREFSPCEYDVVTKVLAKTGIFTEEEPVQVLKRLTYEVMEARQIDRSEVERLAPNLHLLLIRICERTCTTRMTSSTLDQVFLHKKGQWGQEAAAIAAFTARHSLAASWPTAAVKL